MDDEYKQLRDMEEYKELRKKIIELLYPNITYSDSSWLFHPNQCKSSLQPTLRPSTPPRGATATKRVIPSNIEIKIHRLKTTVRKKHGNELVDPVISYLNKYKFMKKQP